MFYSVKVNYLLIFWVFISLCEARGQESSSNRFDRRYLDVSITLLVTDILEAHRVADSLVEVSADDEQKVKSHMLLAKIFEKEGDIHKSLSNALIADTISNSMINSSWTAVTSGFLATTYFRLGLLRFSTYYLHKAEKANYKTENSKAKTLTQINILHQYAIHNLVAEDYLNAKKIIIEATRLITTDNDDDKRAVVIKASNDHLRGIIDFNLGNLNEADSLLNASLMKIIGVESELQPYIFKALADISLETGNMEKAYSYLMKVEQYLKKTNVENLKILTYISWSKYFEKTNDYLTSLAYSSKVRDLQDDKSKRATQLLEDFIDDLSKSKASYRIQYKFSMLAVILMVFLLSVFFIFFNKYFKLVKKNEYLADGSSSRQSSINLKLENNLFEIKTPKIKAPKVRDEKAREIKNVNISKETEERLLQELIKQEKKLFFLAKTVTLQQLASEMGTNPRYVTYSLQKFRGKDFYNYLQGLRIDYIIGQLHSSPDYLNMKLSYLADICGFASASKFSLAFKAITGTPPSVFIHLIRKESEKEIQ